MKLLLYCTKQKPYSMNLNTKYFISSDRESLCYIDKQDMKSIALNGKIIAECDFEIEKIYFEENCDIAIGSFYQEILTDTLSEEDLCKKSCLTDGQLYGYLENGTGYAIHIKNLNIFDKPRDIKDLVLLNQYRKDLEGTQYNRVKTAPQNMCLVDYSVNAVDKYKNYIFDCPYVLISIRPEWLCKILNGEKTIEIRKKILKEMMQNA